MKTNKSQQPAEQSQTQLETEQPLSLVQLQQIAGGRTPRSGYERY